MILPGAEMVQYAFIVFCRIGMCLMVISGFSSPRIPVQIRLFIAFAVTAMTLPIVAMLEPPRGSWQAGTFFTVAVAEAKTGLVIGLLGRCFFVALQFVAVAIAGFIGLGAMPGAPVADDEPAPPIASLIMVMATLLVFATGQHIEMVRALMDSYAVVPINGILDVAGSLDRLGQALGSTFLLALQLSGPFLLYGISINFLFGLANKMIPQIPVYFISLPFVVAGGLLVTYSTLPEMLLIFIHAYLQWLRGG